MLPILYHLRIQAVTGQFSGPLWSFTSKIQLQNSAELMQLAIYQTSVSVQNTRQGFLALAISTPCS